MFCSEIFENVKNICFEEHLSVNDSIVSEKNSTGAIELHVKVFAF